MLGNCCAFTGHRPSKFPWKYDETDSRCVALKAVLEDQIAALERADSIVYVRRTYHKNCMLKRNRFLVDHAAALLAVYSGEQRGGTAAAMRYAQKMDREIIVIDPITQLITHDETAPSLAQS